MGLNLKAFDTSTFAINEHLLLAEITFNTLQVE